MENILVSVVMPSYNTPENYLHEAVNSVLEQSYTNFELLIIDDGSEVPVEQSLGSISDTRVKVLDNHGNRGLPYSLNNGIENSRGKYIFRMDADDICNKNRFERQINFLESNPDVDILATFAHTFGSRNVLYYSPTSDSQIKAGFLWKNELVHPTVAMRSETVNKYNLRYKEGAASEDYELWTRAAFECGCRFAVIPEELLRYRIHGGQVTKNNSQKLRQSEFEIIKRVLNAVNISLNDDQLRLYDKLRFREDLTDSELSEIFTIMRFILSKLPDELDKAYLKKLYRRQALKYCLDNKRLAFVPKIIKI